VRRGAPERQNRRGTQEGPPGKTVRIVRAKPRTKNGRGARMVAHLRARGDVAMSTDAIMALTRDE
jgi:hypothetical protein